MNRLMRFPSVRLSGWRRIGLTVVMCSLVLGGAVNHPTMAVQRSLTRQESKVTAPTTLDATDDQAPARIPVPPGTTANRLSPSRLAGNTYSGLGSCGLNYCWAPGEPVVAVGPSDLVETVNSQAAVYDKATGAQLALYPFESFWTGGSTEQCIDPRVIYLPGDSRFAMSCTDFPANVMRFAISKTGDPTNGWYTYSVGPADDQDKILATSDKFIIAGNGTGEDIYVYNKSDVTSGVANPAVVHLTTAHSNLYQAAVEQTYTGNGYLVATYPGADEWLATVTGTVAAGTVRLTEADLGPTSDAAPREPAVPGGFIGNGDLDGRVYEAVYETVTSDHKPVIQYSSADQCGSPARDCVVSARIDLSGTAPVRQYEESLGEPGWDDTYGAVGMDAAGQVFEAYSRSNASNAPGAAARGPGFAVTLQPATPGASSCSSGQTPPCDERWGDYVSTAIDPSDPASVWVTGLYQLTHGPFGSGAYDWATIIAKLGVRHP
jgi:hypothetical protein